MSWSSLRAPALFFWVLASVPTVFAAGATALPTDLPGPVAAAFAGDAVPVLVRVAPEAADDEKTFSLPLAPGEAPRDSEITVATADDWRDELGVRVVERYPDGSAARVEISAKGLGAGETLLLVRPFEVADPAGMAIRGEVGLAGSERPGVTVFGGAVAALVEAGLWHGDLEEEGTSRPAWWDEAEARFPVGTDPEDLEGRIEFVQVAYAEKGRPRRAIRLFQEIAADARPDDATAPARVRSWLRACHEIAHLYGGSLQDHPRALGWSLRCAAVPLDASAEERQNRIAAGLGAVRAVAGLGHGDAAVALDRILARDLLLDPDPYGSLLLPQIFLRIGDAELVAGAEEAAKTAFRAAIDAAERLQAGVPSNYLAPGSAARASLRRLEARGLALSRVPDGTYEGEAFGYNAPVEVRLTFDGGRCTELHVTDLGDKRPLDAYRVLPGRILETQSLEVDAVTGATVTSRAIVSAATDAVFAAGRGGRPGWTGGDDEGRPGDR